MICTTADCNRTATYEVFIDDDPDDAAWHPYCLDCTEVMGNAIGYRARRIPSAEDDMARMAWDQIKKHGAAASVDLKEIHGDTPPIVRAAQWTFIMQTLVGGLSDRGIVKFIESYDGDRERMMRACERMIDGQVAT
jgi:hypothetical protein